ncbi:MAG: hypothetical protein IID16_09200 [Candidatus Marinimicrobia bacterium]|nr:hypothetical protein [Candidatus Neomarinimicrobiota bacterium]
MSKENRTSRLLDGQVVLVGLKPQWLGFPTYPELKHGAIHINPQHLTIRLLAEMGSLNVYKKPLS